MKWKGILSIGLLAVVSAIGFQQDAPDDPNPEWEGQKAWCNNYHDNAHKCRCAQATECHRRGDGSGEPNLYGSGDTESEMGAKCKTYCRKDHCHCISPCES